MGLSDLIFDGETLWTHWDFLLDFVFRHLLKQPHKLTQKLSLDHRYNTILTLNWCIGAFVITTVYGGKLLEIHVDDVHVDLKVFLFVGVLTGMLTKPSPPKLLNSVEELVQQEEIGYFIEIGARNENLGKYSPPGSALKYVSILCK